jgi:hypothetical protein
MLVQGVLELRQGFGAHARERRHVAVPELRHLFKRLHPGVGE